MGTRTWKIADTLRIAVTTIVAERAAPAKPPRVHHLIVIDCSGSMSGDLDDLRSQLKNKLASLVREGDTVTLIWFSGRGQYGIIVEAAPIRDLVDLSDIHRAIDRFLRPVGLTGFKEPLEEAHRLIVRIAAKDPDAVFSLFFMTDGGDNQWSVAEILRAAEALAPRLASSTVVEYGWYCNRQLLTRIAETIGAAYVFSEDFPRYAPVFENAISKRINGVRKREVPLPTEPRHDVAFAVRSGEILTLAAYGQRVMVPEDVEGVFYLAEEDVGDDLGDLGDAVAAMLHGEADLAPLREAYVLLGALAQRMQADDVLRLLKALGDVRYIKAFANCFGKQAVSAFVEMAEKAAFDASARFVEGRDPDLVPAEDAYTVVDLLHDLLDDDAAMLHVAHPAFSYSRIGRKTVNAAERLTAEEQEEVRQLTEKAKSPADLEAVQRRISEILAAKPKAMKFEPADRDAGVPLSSITFNEDRPNVSLLTRQDGHVELPANAFPCLPERFPTFVWRNYTVIKDGILNLKVLPVSVGPTGHAALSAHGLVTGAYDPETVYEVRLDGLPIINRRMVRRVSAEETFALAYRLTKAKGAQKVFKHYSEMHFPKEKSAGIKAIFGEEAAEFLKGLGVTDGGFAPKVVQDEATDFYLGRELKIALKGLSSLPKVDDVAAKLDSGKKLGGGDRVLAPYVEEYRAFLASDLYRHAADPTNLLRTWLTDKASAAVREARSLNRRLAEIKFSITVGQVWFEEFSSLDEGTKTIEVDGVEVTGTATLREVEAKI